MAGDQPIRAGERGQWTEGATFSGPTAFQTGDGNIQNNHFHAASRLPVTWPRQVGVVPRQADGFQHRDAIAMVAEAVADGGTAVVCQVLAGTGGVGKTQIAAHYARSAWDTATVDLLVWVTATSREAIQTGYANAATEVADADPTDPVAAAEVLLAWLASTEKRWLIILDDVADPADLRGLWPPDHRQGRALVTTRRRDAALTGPGRPRVDVGLFTPAEAAAYLTAILAAHDRHDPSEQVAALAADLGHLPLALAQAAAYLVDLPHLDCAAYRQRLSDRTRTLAELTPENKGLPDDQQVTVAAAWSLSIDRADQLRPAGLARPMLELASMLDPNGIPAAVLTSIPTRTYLADRRTSRVDNPARRRRRFRWPGRERPAGKRPVRTMPPTRWAVCTGSA